LSQQLNAGSYYVLQTNYDHWTQPPWFDDRVDPGMQCMNETGQANINFKTLYNVLDTKPVRNQLTTYTVLMDVKTGAFEVYMQYCPPPCVPW
jgi:acid ceramidase